ncbi:MAG TPA: alpha-N-arabinofuranosidase [Candidatus Sulfotelmatobacter sp.]|nr:alpha-N-arabinofuranosidase [Candidatus Sulfotelmatobacter sp.]
MNPFLQSRRQFLKHASGAALAGSTGLAFGRSSDLFAEMKAQPESSPARVYIDTRRTISPLDRNLFGSFLEHIGRAIYEGIYEPGSKLADSNGFRKDVLDEIRKLGVTIVRYPGGNFVSGYNWLDGVGPKESRPTVLDKAWDTLESNQFGTNEFVMWCKAAGCAPLMGLNFGTGSAEDAAAIVEYCNVDQGTKWSDLRRKHGYTQPHKIQHWCLGNEMDGPWQIGHMSAREYGSKAADAARQMRMVDPSLQLVACGSSGPGMPTYLEWDREVLEECYEDVDGLSLHRYFGNTARETGNDSSKYLAMNLSMEKQIAETLAVCDMVRGHKRSPKQLWLSFDEWNVWYRANKADDVDGHRKQAPHLVEEVYNLEDALLVGGLLNSLIRNADRVKIACLAQLVNAIAPIMTNADGLYRQTTYYPYSWALQWGRGSVLRLLNESPAYEVPEMDHVPYVDVAGTFDEQSGKVALFLLNRDLAKSRNVEVVWQDQAPAKAAGSWLITGDDLKASNSSSSPGRVAPQAFSVPAAKASRTVLELPARSYTAIQWSLA